MDDLFLIFKLSFLPSLLFAPFFKNLLLFQAFWVFWNNDTGSFLVFVFVVLTAPNPVSIVFLGAYTVDPPNIFTQDLFWNNLDPFPTCDALGFSLDSLILGLRIFGYSSSILYSF